MRHFINGFLVLLLTSWNAFAAETGQENLAPGKYSGTFLNESIANSSSVGLDVLIENVDQEGRVTALLNIYRGPCVGTYPMIGTYKHNVKISEEITSNNVLVLSSTSSSGRAGDCNFSFRVIKNGDKLEGRSGVRGQGARKIILTR